jgi:hypothetical protein
MIRLQRGMLRSGEDAGRMQESELAVQVCAARRKQLSNSTRLPADVNRIENS